MQEWITSHGEHPDYLTKVGLLNTATASAREMVLTRELYELIPAPPDPPMAELDQPSQTDPDRPPWTQRWTRTQYRSEPDEEMEELVADLWPAPDFSAVFRIKAGYLIGGPGGGPPATSPGRTTRWPPNWHRRCTATCETTACPPSRGPGVAVRRA